MRSLYSWLAVTLLSGGLALLTSPGVAVGQGVIFEQDHLKCYRVIKDSNPLGSHVVDLTNRQFGDERQCKVSKKARYLCAPTVKVTVDGQLRGNDPLGGPIDQVANDYLCYPLRCPDPKEVEVVLRDQFSEGPERRLKIKPAQLLCTPVVKFQPPLIPCQQASAPACAGECPTGSTCRQPSPTADCVCLD